MASFFDTWERADRDLSRGADAPTSREAFEKIRPHLATAQAELLVWLVAQGEQGGTMREYAAFRGVGFNCVSGRASELKAMGKIRPTGLRREGCAVYVANPEAS